MNDEPCAASVPSSAPVPSSASAPIAAGAPAPARALVVRLGSLGDLVHTLPAVASLREAWPSSEIDWLVERPHAELLSLVPVVSDVVVMGERSVGGWLETRRRLRERRYDVAIDFQGLVKSAALARLSGARNVLGFGTASLREPSARWFYTRTAAICEGRHVIDKNLALVAFAIGMNGGRSLSPGAHRFPLRIPESPALARLRADGVGDYVVINPGAAWPNKRWPVEKFADVVRRLSSERGLMSVVLWGPGERDVADAIVTQSAGAARLAPETTLVDVLAIARGARLFVSGDTGPLHLAGAVGTPLVSMFGPTTPARNGPWDDRDVSLSRYESCACHYKRVCQQPGDWCLETIGVDEVMQAIAQRLESV